MITEFTKGRLKIKRADTRAELDETAARDVAAHLCALLSRKREVNVVFASAPSQNEFLAALLTHPEIDWGRINAFHMDEYIGISPEAPQSFGKFLRERIFSKVGFHSVHCMNPQAADPEAECRRYAELLERMPADVVFLGIGENGHLAFNDPHVAFFDDPLIVKVVDLDPACREQQVHDGCFSRIEEVPTHAMTLTIPVLLDAERLFAIVPTEAKARAIRATCDGPIRSDCPASILRTHRDATLYIDRGSASLLDR